VQAGDKRRSAAVAPLEADPLYGAVIAHFPSDRWRLLLTVTGVGGASAVVLNFTTAAIPGWIGPALTIVLMAGIALGLLWYALHLWNREVILYAHGLSAREGSRLVFFFYEELRGVRLRAERLAYFGGLVRRPVYTTTIISLKDETLIVDGTYKRAAEFGGAFWQAASGYFRARTNAALTRGEAVAFGAGLAITRGGVRAADRVLAWADCRGYRAVDRQLHVLGADGEPWTAVPLRELENLPLLIALIKARSGCGERA